MVIIERKRYLEKLICRRENGQVKIITGIRRCGKSFLLNTIYRDYLLQNGVMEEQIIMLDLDDYRNVKYRNPLTLGEFLHAQVSDKAKQYYIFLDEIQKVESIHNPYLPKEAEDKIGFVDVLNGLKNLPNVDVYVTGSNSKMLSSDIATEFRGRGDIIPLAPLTYDEFYAAFPGENCDLARAMESIPIAEREQFRRSQKRHAWREFITYGGMPKALSFESHEEKAQYLTDLFRLIYIKDVIERNRLKADEAVLDELLNVISSAVGSLTNPTQIADTFQTVKKLKIKNETISRYLDCFIDAFILSKAQRYDIKGRSYIETPLKYYFSDIGLRNAKINFRQNEENHIMENVLYNELVARGFSVDVGVVEYNHKNAEGKNVRSYLEVDFVVNKGAKRYYIQSALTVAEEDKRMQEVNSLNRIDDSFDKIVIVKDDILPWTDEHGVRYFNIEDFLLGKINEL